MAFVIVTSSTDKRPKWYMRLRCHCEVDMEKVVVPAIRMACTAVFLYHALHVNWQSFMAFIAVVASFIFLKPWHSLGRDPLKPRAKNFDPAVANPLKGKPRVRENELPPEEVHDIERNISQMVLYNAEDVESLKDFQVVKDNTECVFAKKAKHWGSPQWNDHLTLEENVRHTLPTFYKFTMLCEKLGLDGFLWEIPGEEYGQDVHEFGQAVRRVMTVISDHDPRGRHCMDKTSSIDKKGWVFEFNRITFFITTFAPCYPETSSRYSFESEHAYILFQPEISFAQHDLPPDTPETNWDEPQTVRDRTRVAFTRAGRPYRIRETLFYPMAHDIVKPLKDFESDEVIEWWKTLDTSSEVLQCPHLRETQSS